MQGFKYLATHQPASKTLEHLIEGESFLAFSDNEVVGTITLYHERPESGCEYYRQKGIFSFGQFAVRPKFQSQGLGSKLLATIESRALQRGATHLALDTAENANQLIKHYTKSGYSQVATVNWDVTNYISVVMSKRLGKILTILQ